MTELWNKHGILKQITGLADVARMHTYRSAHACICGVGGPEVGASLDIQCRACTSTSEPSDCRADDLLRGGGQYERLCTSGLICHLGNGEWPLSCM
jgi:hypothetical protein